MQLWLFADVEGTFTISEADKDGIMTELTNSSTDPEHLDKWNDFVGGLRTKAELSVVTNMIQLDTDRMPKHEATSLLPTHLRNGVVEALLDWNRY